MGMLALSKPTHLESTFHEAKVGLVVDSAVEPRTRTMTASGPDCVVLVLLRLALPASSPAASGFNKKFLES